MNNSLSLTGVGRLARRARGRLAPAACRVLFPIGLAICIAGCRSYERQPLDAAAIRDAWPARSPESESARQFADRLSILEGEEAAAFDAADGLTLAEAEPVALLFNRELRVARREADVARARADHLGRWEDPVAGVDMERIVSGVAEPWVIGGTIGLTIPISGRLAAAQDQANAEHSAQLQRVAAKEWAVRTALRELWIEWSAQVHRSRMASELIDRLRSVADLAERQEQAGVMSRVDARLFHVELAVGEAEAIATHARARELELQIRDLLGLTPDAPLKLVESVVFAPRAIDIAAVESDNAELAAARREYDVAERSLALEVRKQYPDLTIGPGFGTDQGDDRVLLGVRLPIPLWNRNQLGVAEAFAEREAARSRFESAYERVMSKLAVAQARHEAGRAMREAIETHVLPLADEQGADVQRVAELGRVDPLLLMESIKSQYAAKARLVDARAAEAIGAIRLDELLGPPVRRSHAPVIDPAATAPTSSGGSQ